MRNLDSEVQKTILILINTGIRKEELFHLEKADINFEHGTLHVKSIEGRTTKNYQSRIVPLSEVLISLFRHLPDGKAIKMSQNALRHRFSDFKKETGFQRVIHELRHTFISRMLKVGIDKRTVQEWVGQKTPGVIEKYSHVVPETNETWRRLINKGVNIGAEFLEKPANIIELGHQMGTTFYEPKKRVDFINNINTLKTYNVEAVGVEPTSEKASA